MYNVILADPPWKYQVFKGNKGKRTAESFYPCLSTEEIANLQVASLVGWNCALFLWVTAPLLPDGLKIIETWGFRYITIGFTWIKTTKNGKIFKGMGHYTRANAELCLLGIRGRMPVFDHSVSQVIVAPRQEHSRKPDEVYERIEQLYPNANYVELFARRQRVGWDAWGNELDPTLRYGKLA